MTTSRRLQSAAGKSGAIGIAIRRWRRQHDALDVGQPTAAATRWRVSALPSRPLPVEGVGRGKMIVGIDPVSFRRERGFRSGGMDGKGSLSPPIGQFAIEPGPIMAANRRIHNDGSWERRPRYHA
jgi:protein ImuA